LSTRHNVAVPLRVEVNPDLLVWARERSGADTDDLTRRSWLMLTRMITSS